MPVKDLPKWKQELFKQRLESEPRYVPGDFESDFDKYLQYSERFLNNQCLMCGGPVGEKHEVVGPEGKEESYVEEAPLCSACVSKPTPPMLKDFAEQWDIDINPGHVGADFYEETMDPKEIEDRYMSVGEDELRQKSGPVSMETIRKIEPKTPKNMEDLYRINEEMGRGPQQTSEEFGGWVEGIEEGKKYNPVNANIIKTLTKIANELDYIGLYDEANIIDNVMHKYAEDHDQNQPWPGSEWESAMMEMDMSPEELEKEQKYREVEVPTDPNDVEELLVRTKMLLKGTEDPGSEMDIWQPKEESEDVGEKWYFGTEGIPEEDIIYPEDMAEDKPKYKVDVGEPKILTPRYEVEIGEPKILK